MTSLRFVERLRDLVDGVEVILSDIWGVVHNGLESFPEACDALFSQWQRSGGLTDELRWQRAKLAAEAGQYGLASSLIRQLPGLTHKGQLLVEVAQKPQLLKQTGKFVPADRQMADVVGLGLRRIRHTVEVVDAPETRGLILKVRHLVKVEGE